MTSIGTFFSVNAANAPEGLIETVYSPGARLRTRYSPEEFVVVARVSAVA